jgi:ankyrin repeat protein
MTLTDQFVSTACLCYDDPHFDHRSFHAKAFTMLQQNPWLAHADIWCAATAGNLAAVTGFLRQDEHLVSKPGPNGWSPLLCACYSRVQPLDPSHSTFQVAGLLLDRGADPNTFTMKGNCDQRLDQTPHRYTALTGLFGGGPCGMANHPSHPRWRDLADLLLTRGADPADQQALRITQDRETTYGKLEILLRHGLPPAAMGHPLSSAVLAGDVRSVRLLLAHQAPTGEPFRGKLPWRHAMDRGHLDIARMLEQAGAPVTQLDELEHFISMCMAGIKIDCTPELLSRAPRQLVLMASGTGRREAVELALDLGFDPNYLDEVTALHASAASGKENAAGGNQQGIMRLLLSRGGSLTIREPFYDGTPVGWADFFDQRSMRDMLLDEGDICLFDALDFNRLDRIPDILQRDPAALNRPFAQCLSREPQPEDWQTPLQRMEKQGNAEAIRILFASLKDAADTLLTRPPTPPIFNPKEHCRILSPAS